MKMKHAFLSVVGLIAMAGLSQASGYTITTFTILDYPGAIETDLGGISGETGVGQYYDPSSHTHGFIYDGSTYTTLDGPGAVNTALSGISGGTVVGAYENSPDYTDHGFIYNGSTFATLDVLWANYTFLQGISGNTVMGDYTDQSGNFHSFIARVPELASAMLAVVGIAGLGLLVRRRRRMFEANFMPIVDPFAPASTARRLAIILAVVASGLLTAGVAPCALGREFGVDVSHYQDSSGIPLANWQAMAAEGISFTFIKANEGLTGPDDPTMAANVANASAAGILNGVYHYAHAENRPSTAGAIAEADKFMSYAGDAISPGHLRPVLDIEGATADLSETALSDWVAAFIGEVVAVKGLGAAPIIYTNPYFTLNKLDSRFSSGYDLWIGDGGTDPMAGGPPSSDLGYFPDWSFWQYSTSGSVGGISPIDLDVAHSEYKSLSSFLIPAAVPEPTSAMLIVVGIAGLGLLVRPRRSEDFA